mmetsp:Transcript_24051/g.43940  ORF Transcript_24051/g.43940 Transcript_24051/m.43940 type:complete len:411 (-) Transcript_24051:48-1280(-)
MMSAVNTWTPYSSAISLASRSILTSKARIVAYSFFPFSSMMDARMTSFLWMGPMPAFATGMGGLHSLRRNSSSASSAPRVEACTMTPCGSIFSELITDMSFITSSLMSSTSSSGPTTMTLVPATTFSICCALIFTPMAALRVLWWMYSDLMRSSRFGGGVSSALMVVTTGPSRVAQTMVSPSRNSPFTMMTSMVVPSPSMTLTSNTVHCRVDTYMILVSRRSWLYWIRRSRMSATPSPVMAEVGHRDTTVPGSGFSQYSSAFSPCSMSCTRTCCMRSRNSCTVFSSCFSRAWRIGKFVSDFQLYKRSTLFSATMKGVRLRRSSEIDSSVCGSRPCMRSITRMAMSHRFDPRERRLVNASCPGVSMISTPGTLISVPLAVRRPWALMRSSSVSREKKVAPICWVIPPASPS